jgi:hypothetical protein
MSAAPASTAEVRASQEVLKEVKNAEANDVDPAKLSSTLAAKRGALTAMTKAHLSAERATKFQAVADEVLDAQASGAKYFLDGGPFFSFTPLVAFRGGLHGTAIPAVAVNVQPFDFGKENWATLLGVQAILGGVLNPASNGSGPSAAVGAGLWYPIGSTGSICVGCALWEEGSETRSGLYIGLNLGQERKTSDTK